MVNQTEYSVLVVLGFEFCSVGHFQEKTEPNIFRIIIFRKKTVRFGSVYDTEALEFGYLVFTTHRSTNWIGLHFQSHGLSIIENL